tara:strand:+ start:593 stop:907 length:315 start_codon:yes stop_codon:yes gene_type:complete
MTSSPLRKTYAQQRKDRLQEAIDDYLNDNEVSISEFYNDLRDCLEDIISYHERSKTRAQGALELVLGHRTQQDLSDTDTQPNSYEYAADITLSKINQFQRGSHL